jgi:hypothetical protein
MPLPGQRRAREPTTITSAASSAKPQAEPLTELDATLERGVSFVAIDHAADNRSAHGSLLHELTSMSRSRESAAIG